MKRFLILISLAVLGLASSCVKEAEPQPGPGEESYKISVETTATKLYFGDKTAGAYPVLWSEGDKIAVNGIESEGLPAGSSAKQLASFEVKYYISAPYKVVYPASALNSDGKIVIPVDQTYSDAQFDQSACVLLGQNSTSPITLNYACAFVKVTMAKGADETLKRVKLYSGDGAPLGGVFTPDYSTATLTYKEAGRNYISVSSDSGIPYNAQNKAEVVFVLPAGNYAKGFLVSATTTDGKQMSKKAYGSTGVNLVAGQLVAMPELTFADDGLPFSGGAGTAVNPYKIATSEDIQNLSDFCNNTSSYANYADKYYVQVADIDMDGVEFSPIGSTIVESTTYAFTGTYDGQNHVIENMHPTTTTKSSAFFGILSGATVKDITFRSATCSGTYPATVAGYLIGGTVSGIKVFGSQITATDNVCAGIVGVLRKGTISSCTVDKTSSISGASYTGGITGSITVNISGGTSTIENCQCDASVTGAGNVGGICGFTSTDDKTNSKAYITSCISTGNVNATAANAGGITGYVRAFTEVIIRGCKSYGNVTNTAANAGGIVGYGVAKNVYEIDKCAAYGNITGLYSVAGIAGYQVPNDATNAKLVIANCLYAGECLTALGNNGENGYCIIGGIVGWWQNTKGYMRIVNCADLHTKVVYPASAGGYASSKPSAAGIVAVETKTANANCYVKGCYSILQPNGIIEKDASGNGDDKIAQKCIDLTSYTRGQGVWATADKQYNQYFGPIYGVLGSTIITLDHCYKDTAMGWYGPQDGSLTMSNMGSFGRMSELCDNLNAFKAGYSDYPLVDWSIDERGYPTPGISSKNPYSPQPLRISIIGDSISTFLGWIPVGNAIYYHRGTPKSGKTLDFNDYETYWNRLINAYLPNARFEKNIAWSASCVTNYDTAVRGLAVPGFAERFESQGIGVPDVLLIHGGTNDRSRGVYYDAGTEGYTQPMYNTGTYDYKTEVPESALQAIYAKKAADQDISRFLDANVKMVQRTHELFPNAKIVFICGDCIDPAMAHGLMHIAEHYDFVKCVDFRKQGYNWLPKYDGSHPTKAGHDAMASQIYNEVGQWLLEGTSTGYGTEGYATGTSTDSFVTNF